VYCAFLQTYILDSPKYGRHFTRNFYFFMDLADGHQQSIVARNLELPLLVFSKHPQENYSLPVPDLYQVT
jgi:hypothetical protein